MRKSNHLEPSPLIPLNLKVSEGAYSNYKIKFELSFIRTFDQIEQQSKADADIIDNGIHIGNTIGRWDATLRRFLPHENEKGEVETIGGITSYNKDIIMNVDYDTKMNRLHEIFHTFGFDDFKKGEKGYGIMNYPPMRPTQTDANNLIYNGFLPVIYE